MFWEKQNANIVLQHKNKSFGFYSIKSGFFAVLLTFIISLFLVNSSFAVSYSATMTTSGPVILSSKPNSVAIDDSEINVITNCKGGYNLLLSTSTVDNNLYLNGDSNNNQDDEKFIPTNSSNSLKNNIGTWGYHFSSSEPNADSIFQPIPGLNNQKAVIKTLNSTISSGTINDSFSIYYGANVKRGTQAGAYSLPIDPNTNAPGTLSYYLTINPYCTDIDISFNQNLDGAAAEDTDDSLANFPSSEDITINLDSLTLPDQTPTRNGFIFEKWNTMPDGNGDSYFPNDTLTISDRLNSQITLYAIWETNTPYLQNWTGCHRLEIGETTTLIDNRDNTVYNIGRLADGDCWFLDNLALNIASQSVKNKLSSQNTNASDLVLHFLKGEYIGSPSDQYATSLAKDSLIGPSYSDPRIYSGEKDTIPESTIELGNGNHKVGIYYNYCAVSAGSYCYGDGSEGPGNPSGNATEDICPKAWHLPSGGPVGEYNELCSAIKGSSCDSGAIMPETYQELARQLSLSYSGLHSNNMVIGINQSGQYWTSTSSATAGSSLPYDMKRVIFSDGDIMVNSNRTRDYGLSVRCKINNQNSHKTTVIFDEHIESVSFTNASGDTETATKDNDTVFLLDKEPHIVVATASDNYKLSNWEVSSRGTLSSTTNNPTVLTIVNDTMLTVNSEATDNPSESTLTMQNFNCSFIPEGIPFSIIDARDNTSYRITKLEDGKCWMLDNLAIDLSNPNIQAKMTSNTTNASNHSLDYLKGELSRDQFKDPNGKYATSAATNTSFSNWNQKTDNVSIPQFNLSKKDSIAQGADSLASQALAGNWKTGGYYNYCAASAGSHCYSKAALPEEDLIGAQEDICPAGWKLPDSEIDYDNIMNNLNSYSLFRTTLYIPMAGIVNNNALQQEGSCFELFSNGPQDGDTCTSYIVSPDPEQPYQSHGANLRCIFGTQPFITVHINLDPNTKSITFKNESKDYEVTTTGDDVELRQGVEYSVTANAKSGYKLANWSTTESGTLSSSTSNPTTYTVSNEASLTTTSQENNSYMLTVNLDEHTRSVSFYNADLGTQQVTTNGATISLKQGALYTVTSSHDPNYIADSWNTNENGTIHGNPTDRTIKYSVTGNATLAISSKSMNTLQDFTCQSLSIGDEIELMDSRDGTMYKVGKLQDDNCWMLDNLAINLTDQSVQLSLNSKNTNATNKGLSYLINGNETNARLYAKYPVSTDWLHPQYTYNKNVDPKVHILNKENIPEETSDPLNEQVQLGNWKTGGYYNMCAAFAGTNCLDYSSGSITRPKIATQDICPANWRIPTGGENGDFKHLADAIHGSTSSSYTNADYNTFRTSLHIPLVGHIFPGSGNVQSNGASTTYWSATSYNSTRQYDLNVYTSSFAPLYYTSDITYGNSIRCIYGSPQFSNVSVNLDSNIESITIENELYGTETVTSNSTIELRQGVEYNITATPAINYNFNNWESNHPESLNNTTAKTTTLIVSGDTSISAISRLISEHEVTVNFDEHVNSISFYNADYGVQSVTSDGDKVTLKQSIPYLITASYDIRYSIDNWATTENGTLKDATKLVTNYSIIDDATLTLTSKLLSSMQSFDYNSCRSLNVGEHVHLYDNRDNTQYEIAKLQDNNCWMLDNFTLDLTNPTVQANLNSSTTNATDESISYLLGEQSRDPNTNPNGKYPTSAVSDDANKGIRTTSYSDPRINTSIKDDAYTEDPNIEESKDWKYGIFYNTCAATAGSSCYGNGTSTNHDAPTKDFTEDICPAGWRLPTSSYNGEYQTLAKLAVDNANPYDDSALAFRKLLHLNLGGHAYGSDIYELHSRAWWLSKTDYNHSSTYALVIYAKNIFYNAIYGDDYGHNIRCIVDQPTHQVTVDLPEGVNSILFTNPFNGTQTAFAGSPIVNLKAGTAYFVTYNLSPGYRFVDWSTSDTGAINYMSGSDQQPFYSITDDANFSISVRQLPSHNVTVTFDEHVKSIGIYNSEFGTVQVTESGTTIPLREGITYDIIPSFESNYGFGTWTTSENGTLIGAFSKSPTYKITGDSTLALTSNPIDVNTSMQSFTSATCNDMEIGSSIDLFDTRDGNKYSIGKLADGNCWMLDNLSLDLTDVNTQANLNSDTTNASNTSIEYLLGKNTRNPSFSPNGRYATSKVDTASQSSYSDPRIYTKAKNDSYQTYLYNIEDQMKESAMNWRYGIYYNYCAARAGSFCYGNNDTRPSSSTTVIEAPEEDICPSGWRLPTGNTDGEYNSLYRNSLYNTYENYRNALHLTIPGYVSYGLVSSIGSLSDYWTADNNGTSMGRSASVTSSSLSLDNSISAYRGSSIRCIFNPLNTVTINLSPEISSISFYNARYGTKTITSPASTVQLHKNTDYIVTATMKDHAEFANWLASENGFLSSTTDNPTTFTITGDTNLTAFGLEIEPMQITYNANNHPYEDSSTENTVSYYTETIYEPLTHHSHTSNITDAGVTNGNYSNNMDTIDTVTVNGATSLSVTIYYDTESTSFDWVSVYQSPFNISNSNDANSSTTTGNRSGKLAGRKNNITSSYSSWYANTYTITGDTVKFHFRSDGSVQYYGYYAVITGLDSNNNPITSATRNRTPKEGAYQTPVSNPHDVFLGWSKNPNAIVPTYTSEEDVKANLPGMPGDNITLYAVYDTEYPVTVNFDTNISSLVFTNANHTPIEVTETGTTIYLHHNTDYLVTASTIDGYWVANWSATDNYTFSNTNNRQTVYTVTGTSSLTAASETAGPLVVTYDGNGLTFENDATTNLIAYDSTKTTEYVDARYSHTANIDDTGVATGSYANNLATKDVINIPGASTLGVTVYYSTEANYDYVYVFNGANSGSVSKNMSAGQLKTYNGGAKTTFAEATQDTFTITGDTVTFAFYSDVSQTYYGYHAIVTGYDSNGDPVQAPIHSYNKTIMTGAYQTPTSASRHDFLGWSENPNATTPTYIDEADIKSNLHVLNGYNVTLYAIYNKYLTIRYDANDGTGTMSDQTVKAGSSITLTNNAFSRDNYTFEKWNTNPEGTGTSYNNRTSYTAPSSTTLGQVVTLYAQWLEHKTVTVNFDEHVRSVGFYSTTYGTQQVTESGSSVTLNANVPYLISSSYETDYSTNSWSTTEAGTLNATNSAATTYTVTDNATLTLTSQSIQSIANFTLEKCDAMNIGDTVYLYDPRDHSAYNIGKLADNKCWMLDNLNLDLTNETVQSNLTPETTNASETTLNYLKNGGGSNDTASELYRYAKNGVIKWTSSYSYINPLINDTSKNTIVNTYGHNNGKVGIYYNYCAASAGSYCFDSGTSSSIPAEELTEDICPAGWRIPKGGNTNTTNIVNDYQILYNAYPNSPTNFRNGLSLPLSGYYYSGSTNNLNSNGYFWSSTYSNTNQMYTLASSSSSINLSSYNNRYYGYSIRCRQINKSDTYNVTINLDSHTTSITLSNETYGTQTVSTDGSSVTLHYYTPYTITATMENGYDFTAWSTDNNGSVTTITDNPTTFTITGNSTLSTSSEEFESMEIIYNGNGLLFNDSDETNTISYDARDKSTLSGSYLIPSSSAPHNFLGWSTNANSTTAEYSSEEEMKNNLLNYNGETITVYAIYQNYLTIHFDGNGYDTGNVANQIALAGTSIALPENNYRRDGYVFIGWNTKANGTGTSYSAGDPYTIPSTTTLGQERILYANWLEYKTVTITFDEHVRSIGVYNDTYGTQQITKSGTTISLVKYASYIITSSYDSGYGPSIWESDSYGNIGSPHAATTFFSTPDNTFLSLTSAQLMPMAEFTQEQCETMNIGQTINLYDARDNSPYTIIKLDDENCWMRNNLTLNLTDETTVNNLTPENTNASSASLISLKNGNRDNGEQYATQGLSLTEWEPEQSYNDKPLIMTEYKNEYNQKERINSIFYDGMYGYYYNYCAASAGSYCFGNGNEEGTPSGNAIYDICPAGWRMPTNDEYYHFFSYGKQNLTNINRNDLNLSLSGLIDSGLLRSNESAGFWWSSSYDDPSFMKVLLTNTDIVTTVAQKRNMGLPVRCILRSTNHTHNVTVSLNEGISSVTFSNEEYGTETATAENKTVNLHYNVPYTTTANLQHGATFTNWSTTEGGTLSSPTTNSTNYSVINDTTLTIKPTLATNIVNLHLDEHISSVTFSNSEYGTTTVTKDNPTVEVKRGVKYLVKANLDPEYYVSSWSTNENGLVNPEINDVTTFVATGDSTLTAISEQMVYMQDFTQSNCNRLEKNEKIILFDRRDNSAYSAARLEDGLCWMTSDLHIGSTTETMTLTSENTDTVNDFTLPIVETSINNTRWDVHAPHAYQYSNSKIVYSWNAATAGTAYSEMSSNTSICPANWKLLTRAQANNYLSAIGESSGTTNTSILTNPPLSFTTGDYQQYYAYDNSIRYWTTEGWSANDKYYGYFFGINSSNVVTNYGTIKESGLGVRCVLNPELLDSHQVTVSFDSGLASITFTDPNNAVQTATADNPSVSLREGTTYTISASLSDGYTFESWATDTNGLLGSTTSNPATYTVTGTTTLSVNAH